MVVDDSRNGTSPIGGDDVVDDRRCGIKPNKNTQNRIGFRNVAMDKCRHSQVDKKRHTVIQDLSYRHWDKNICSKTNELWRQN